MRHLTQEQAHQISIAVEARTFMEDKKHPNLWWNFAMFLTAFTDDNEGMQVARKLEERDRRER